MPKATRYEGVLGDENLADSKLVKSLEKSFPMKHAGGRPKGRYIVGKLTIRMRKLLRLLTDATHTVDEACALSSINRLTYYAYLRNPVFAGALKDYRDRAFLATAPKIDQVLIAKALKGNVAAIRTYYEKRGEIKTEVEAQPVSINLNIPRPMSAVGTNIKAEKDVVDVLNETAQKNEESLGELGGVTEREDETRDA